MALHKIQAVYSQELKRVLDGEKDSASKPYTSPWRWFQFLDSFLRDQILRSQVRTLRIAKAAVDHCLVGLVVKVFTLRAMDLAFDFDFLLGDFSGSSHTSDLKIDNPVASLPGA